MAHFYGDVLGRASSAAGRVGTKSTGVSGHIRGWGIGAQVDCLYLDEREEDRVWVQLTQGSGHSSNCNELVCEARRNEDKIEVVTVGAAFLLAISDDAWDRVLAAECVASRIKLQLFKHLDKANGA